MTKHPWYRRPIPVWTALAGDVLLLALLLASQWQVHQLRKLVQLQAELFEELAESTSPTPNAGLSIQPERGKDGAPSSRAVVELLASARVTPTFKDDELVGLRVTAIRSSSRLAGAGLRDGDLITKIDDLVIRSPGSAASALEAMAKAQEFSVVRTGSGVIALRSRPR